MSIGLYIGRFQPFHKGHLSAVKQCLKQVDCLVIGVGSTQLSHQKDNPFTFEERKEMIEKTLLQNGIPSKKFSIIPIPDINNDAAWPAHVHSLAPNFEVVFTRSEIVKQLFETYDEIPIIWLKKEVEASSTGVREAIREGDNYQKLLTPSTINWLDQNKGFERIRFI